MNNIEQITENARMYPKHLGNHWNLWKKFVNNKTILSLPGQYWHIILDPSCPNVVSSIKGMNSYCWTQPNNSVIAMIKGIPRSCSIFTFLFSNLPSSPWAQVIVSFYTLKQNENIDFLLPKKENQRATVQPDFIFHYSFNRISKKQNSLLLRKIETKPISYSRAREEKMQEVITGKFQNIIDLFI